MKKSEPDPILNNFTVDVVVDDSSWLALMFDCKTYCKTVVYGVLKELGLENKSELELSVMLSNNSRLQSLNSSFRSIAKPTNVLSFPYYDQGELDEVLERGQATYLGDIAVSYEIIASEANEYGKNFKDHFAHMLVHGVLHLFGYDHEEESERLEMEALEQKILKENFNIINPYIIY
jgi:probable rRNA maturation factor